MSNSRGFTMVEVLVALLLLSLGLLGIVSTLASATRAFTDGHSSVQVAADAADVLERIRSEGCGGALSGARTTSSSSTTWRTDELAPQLRIVTVIVTATSAGLRSRADTFSAIIPC